MSGKWLLQTPTIVAPKGKGSMVREWRFETKTRMLEYCSRNNLQIQKKSGLKYTYIIINPSQSMMRFEPTVVRRR